MKISPTALFSVVMLVVSVGALTMPSVNVNVMNFPLDSEGNLRTGPLNVTITQRPESLTIIVIPFNSTVREALSRFTLFYNHTWYEGGRYVSQLGYRMTLNVSGWETWMPHFFGATVYLDPPLGYWQMYIYHRFRVEDFPAGYGVQPPYYLSLSAWSTDDGRYRAFWSISFVNTNPPIPVLGSLLDIELYIHNETPIDTLRIGLSLYLQR